jgi:K+-transporting ATPase ATPase C chain
MRSLAPAFRFMLLFTVLLGIIYPLAVTGLCRWWFPHQADGSLVRAGGRIVGSSLLGQTFTGAAYFHSRPSAAGNGYDAMASGGSNFAATSPALLSRVQAAVARFRRDNPAFRGPIPSDLLTTSGSGLDPDISPAAAYAQAPRVAQARGLPLASVRQLIGRTIQPRQLGFLGEPRVEVLRLNLALAHLARSPASRPSTLTADPR